METIQRSFWVRESDLLSAQEIKLAIMKTKPGANPDVSSVLRGLFEFGQQIYTEHYRENFANQIGSALVEAGISATIARKLAEELGGKLSGTIQSDLSERAIKAVHPGKANRHKAFSTKPSEAAKKNATGRNKAEVE